MSVNDDSTPAGKEEAGLLPETPIGDFSSQAARSAGQVTTHNERVLQSASRDNRAIVAMPNGELGFLDEDEEYADHIYLAGKHGSVFTNAAALIADPKPGWIYVWAAKYNPKGDKINARTMGNIRAKRYVPVAIDEIKEDTEAPIERTRMGEHQDCVMIVDVVLMAVSPAAQRVLYKWKTNESKRRTNRWQSFKTLQDRVENATGGLVRTEVNTK
jgi:hypothetical protein